VRGAGHARLIGLSTEAPTAPFMADSRLGRADLPTARGRDRSNREGLFRVVLIHHRRAANRRAILKRLLDGRRSAPRLEPMGRKTRHTRHRPRASQHSSSKDRQRRIPVVGGLRLRSEGQEERRLQFYRVEGRTANGVATRWRSLRAHSGAIVEDQKTIRSD